MEDPGAFGTDRAARSLSGGEAVVRALAAHGVTDAFGIPGTHNLEIYRHLRRYGIRHVTARHEQGAGYAADAYARVSGRPGVAITTTGPALLNIAAAVGQAYSDSVPLLVVSPGMPLRHPRQSTGLLHEMRSQTEALRGVAAFSHRVASVDEIGAAVARAFTLFRTERPRPAHIEVPLDLLEAVEPLGAPRLAPPAGPPAPNPAALAAAVTALRWARRPALVLGGGSRAAAAECRALAVALGAPVVTTANGKGVVDERHPLSLGVSLHSPAVRRWLADRDVVLAVGTELAESDVWGPLPTLTGTLIRVDVDPAQMYAGLPADVPLVGDAAAVLGALLAAPLATHRGGARAPGVATTEAEAAVAGSAGVGARGTDAAGADAAGDLAAQALAARALAARADAARSGATDTVAASAVATSGAEADATRTDATRSGATDSVVADAVAARTVVPPAAEGQVGAERGDLVASLRAARDDETRARDARWLPYLRAMHRVLAEDAVITSDSAQCCYYGALPHLPMGPEGRYLHPTGFGTLGYALPAAIGAKTACPERQVVALSGDGGLQFSVQELATAAQLDVPIPVVVFDNGGYGEIREEMAARGDAPTAVDLPAVDLPALARAYGGRGTTVRTPEALAAALAEALTTPGPTIVTVPEESPR
ncbi:thiamine pyrophosphate-dependent enzyme [Streptomyces sp. NPDC012769]|uniref:thiamine pyrophosphate-dependent enzyme n=1 Tax=Streptomyces sp. NPDC012769 TaxID=3364848 RepID=UPI0036BAFE66